MVGGTSGGESGGILGGGLAPAAPTGRVTSGGGHVPRKWGNFLPSLVSRRRSLFIAPIHTFF